MSKNSIFAPFLMAFGKMRETKEFQRDFYTGVGAGRILAVNPTRAEQNKILQSDANLDPINYVDTAKVKDAKGNEIEVPRVRITFIFRTDPKIACNNGIEFTHFITFFISKGYSYSSKNGVNKIQVIDRFGRTGWVTSEELKDHKIPMMNITKGLHAGTQRPANLDPMYRPCFIGEADFIENLRVFMNFPRPDVWDNDQQTYIMKTDEKELAESDCMLDDDTLNAMFKGDVSVIRDVIMSAPKNAYKLMFGVRTKEDGSLQQDVYTRMPVALAATSYKNLEKALLDDATANPPRHPNTFYKAGPLEKYSVQPTDYSEPEAPQENAPVEDLPEDTSPFPQF